MSRSKGNRIVRERAIPYYERCGFFVDKVEKPGRYTEVKDLFATIFNDLDLSYTDSGFDLVCIKPSKLILCQVTTNSPKTQKWYRDFAKKYCHSQLLCHVFTWYDRDGIRLQNYLPSGDIIEADLRKSRNPHATTTIWFE